MATVDKSTPIVLTGGAGLVGANLTTLLVEEGYTAVTVVDKHAGNLATLAQLHPTVRTIEADLSQPGPWAQAVGDAEVVFMLHAQIAAKSSEAFDRNNIDATRSVLDAIDPAAFVVHISSSVVHSVADDDYVRTKTEQERLVRESGRRFCVVRPTLMFGWFDGKHLGWLGRFMERVPVFPIPGHGRYMRQPLYSRDFCRALLVVMQRQPEGEAYDLTGPDNITYVDIIRAIKRVKRSRTLILHIPYGLFDVLLRVYALFSAKPPFTSDQLAALVAGDMFEGVDIEETFGFTPTPFATALEQTLTHPTYSHVVLDSPH